MSRSQQTFSKREKEKKRAKRKKEKMEKRAARKEESGGGLEIDWSMAPENHTLSDEEKRERENIKEENT